MSISERCRMYKETQSSIKKLLEKGLKLDKNIYMNQLVLIKKDVVSHDENVRKPALEMLNFLLRLNIEEIEAELIKILYDNSANKLIQACILKSIRQKVVDAISENKYNFTSILSPWKDQITNKLTNIIEDVCVSNLPRDKSKRFFINTIIPSMMATSTNNQVRDALIDIAFMMSTIFPISDLSADELELFLKNVNTQYVINIGDLRDKDYPNWHNLWIFLVRFCDKHIHYSMDLTNRLLRVVEFAFRNSSIQQRLKGYDCWKELIDNASLDMNHMCSAKQIKLLITPLKAKFSKQEVVICKRFDVFTYLLEKLQNKAVLCLTEFCEFCFGPVGDNKDMSKTGQGKSVPQIWTKSTKVLIEIIGHSHGKNVSCLVTEDIIKLEKPVINYTNIQNYYKVVIKSVGECCGLLKEVDIQSKREIVIKCLWKSVFNLIIPTTESNKKKYFSLVADVLDSYILQSRENPYFEDLLLLIFNVLMSYDEEFVYEVIEHILKQLLTILFTIDDFKLSIADRFKAVLSIWFSKIFMAENKLKVLKETMEIFTKLKPFKENVVCVSRIWLCLANELVADIAVEDIEKFNDFNNFFLWPANHLHYLDEVTKKQTVLLWMKLYRKITTDADAKKLNVMKDLHNVFKSNPLLNPNVVSLLNVMSQFETKFTKEFVNNMMMVSHQILQLPNLKSEEEQKITALVMQYFEPSLECYASDNVDELIKNVCTCVEYILTIHKGYKLLDTLTAFMKNSPPNLKKQFSAFLSPLLLDLFNKESDTNSYNARELQKTLQVLNVENAKDTVTSFVPPVGRSARIARMAKSSPKSPQKRRKTIEPSPTALRLFGKDLDTLSPLQVKGSQLNNVTPKSRKTGNKLKMTPRNLPPINDEKSADFVPIDTEVKFQPEKLSKHQKEVLKKRREDIPALYQDLSQSLSQDIFASSSSSKGFEKTDQDGSGDKRKVIVEVIGEQFEEQKNEAPETLPDVPVSDIDVPNVFAEVELSSEVIPEAPIQIEDLNAPNTDLNFEANLFPDALLPSEIIPEEAIQVVSELTVPNKEMGAEENLDTIEDDKDTISESSGAESKSKGTTSSASSEHPYQIEVVIEGKESAKSEAEEKEKRRKQKIELELQKLRMDIVGAEEFLAASRRTRTREKPKKLDDVAEKKLQSPQRQHMLRKSLNTDVSEAKESPSVAEKNRRKTISSIQETKDIDDSSKPESPKTRGRKSLKIKSEEKPNGRSRSRKILLDKDETEPKEVERGEKRKRSSGDEESEDIIESSQDLHSILTPVFNSSKRKSLTETSLEKLNKSEEKTLVQQQMITPEDFLPENEGSNKPSFEEIVVTEHTNKFENVEVPTETNTSQDTTVTQESTQDLTQEDIEVPHTETHNTEDTQTQTTQTQDTPTQSQFSEVSEDIRPPVLYFDLPKKPELTESERMMCRMDTMSICLDPKNLPSIVDPNELPEIEPEFPKNNDKLSMEMEDVLSTPKSKSSSNIPSSPITVETPNRTSELLSSTLDISPINSKSSSDDGEADVNKVPFNFRAEMEALNKLENEKIFDLILERNSLKEGQEFTQQNSNENGEMPVLLENILTELEEIPNQNEEAPTKTEAVVYQSEQNQVVPQEIENTEIEETQNRPEADEISPSKLDMPDIEIENARPLKDTSIQERASRLLNMVNVSSPMTHRMFMKKRGVTMSPSTARIKKLMSSFNQRPNAEEVVGDVKEEDLLTFSREVPSPLAVPRSSILKRKISDSSESDGVSPCPKRKRVNFSDPCLTSKKLFLKDEYNRDSEPLSVFDEPVDMKADEEQIRKTSTSSEESVNSERLTETENFETEPSLEMINPLMLKKDRPIYPKLVDCKENVILILKRVTSPMFITTLMNKLKSKEIKTIGDLAKQSEAEINRFPFKVPVVPNVYKALDNYYKKNIDKFVRDSVENGEVSKTNGERVEENKRQGVIKKAGSKRVDFRVEFKQLIEKLKTEGTFEDFLKILLPSVEKQQFLSLFRTHHRLEIDDFLPESDFKFALKYITQKIGIPNVLEMLTSTIENTEEESIYYDCVMKQSLEKKSLSNIWENRSLDDIKNGLEESINKNVFNRQEVINRCLFPLIQQPSDIYSYVSRISVVQLSDIVIERLQGTDLSEFFGRILDSNAEHNTTLRKEVFVRINTPSDVVSVFQDCICGQSEENQQEIMVEMFKYVSGKLSISTLLGLHVDFLKRIPNFVASNQNEK